MCGAGAPARESALEQWHRTYPQFRLRKMFNRRRQYPSRSSMVPAEAGGGARPTTYVQHAFVEISVPAAASALAEGGLRPVHHILYGDASALARGGSRSGSGTLLARAWRKDSPPCCRGDAGSCSPAALTATRWGWLAFSSRRDPAVPEERDRSSHQQTAASLRASLGGRIV